MRVGLSLHILLRFDEVVDGDVDLVAVINHLGLAPGLLIRRVILFFQNCGVLDSLSDLTVSVRDIERLMCV